MSSAGLAGHVQRPGVWGVQPPPAPPPSVQPPAVPPSGTPGVPPPQPRRGFPWLWVLLGCGCLVVIVVVGGVLGGAYWVTGRVKQEVESIQQEAPQVPASATDGDAKTTPDATDDSGAPKQDEASASPPQQTTAGPSEDRAIALMHALCDKGWVVKVLSHSDDWKKVTLAAGPSDAKLVGEVELEWKESEYEIVRERAYD